MGFPVCVFAHTCGAMGPAGGQAVAQGSGKRTDHQEAEWEALAVPLKANPGCEARQHRSPGASEAVDRRLGWKAQLGDGFH